MNKALVAWWLSVACAGAVLADDPSAKTAAEAAGVLGRADEGLVEAPPFCFSVGRAVASTDAESAWVAAEKHAGARAIANYLAIALRIDDSPPAVAAELLEDISRRSSAMIVSRLKLAGVETVSEVRGPELVVTVVKAVDSGQLRRETRHWQGCLELIEESAGAGNAADAALLAEIARATGARVEVAVDLWKKFVATDAGVAATIEGRPFSVTDGWLRLTAQLDEARLRQLSPEELLQLLGRRPFDGQLIDAIAGKLRSQGRSVVADEVQRWYRVVPQGGMDEVFQETVDFARVDPNQAKGVAIVLRHAATWPLYEDLKAPPEAVEKFRKGEARTAAALLLRQFGDRPCVDTASYVAACLMAGNRPEIAEPWARVAYARDRRHPYAGVNLARIVERLGRRDEAINIAESMRDDVLLDEWGRAETARIIAASRPQQPEPMSDQEPESDEAGVRR